MTRRVWQPLVVDLAVLNAWPSDIARLRQDLVDAEQATDAEFDDCCAVLWADVASGTHNDVVVAVASMLANLLEHPMWDGVRRRARALAGREARLRQHREIVDAVADRDRERAGTATIGLLTLEHGDLGLDV